MMIGPQGGMLSLAILGGIAWLAILAGIVLLVIWAVRALPSSSVMRSNVPATGQSPLDILARRFAAGEISAEEYQRMRDILRGEEPPKP
jgi:putative membrane protein